MKIVQSGKFYVLYDKSGKVVIISRDRGVCQGYLDSMEQM
tara:strand:+ start:323 stop:442 length:120 start_codon:yes stop_codon:yes gene_type:complete